jgi:hypothetical protein
MSNKKVVATGAKQLLLTDALRNNYATRLIKQSICKKLRLLFRPSFQLWAYFRCNLQKKIDCLYESFPT